MNLLILSHGQATCEKSFSINRLIVVDNTKETSFIAQRSIHDHILHIRGIDALVVSKALLASAASGRKHYVEYLGGGGGGGGGRRARQQRRYVAQRGMLWWMRSVGLRGKPSCSTPP